MKRNVLILSIFFLLFLIPLRVHPQNEYEKLIKLYTKYLQTEEDVFKKLTFKLSQEQLLKKGSNLKFTLEDNLGRKWIFKPYRAKESAAVYHLYRLFGIETPEVHYINFALNGKQITGSIQRYVISKAGLENYSLQRLSIKSLNYLLKSHVVDWFINNFDDHALNYLVLSLDKSENIKDLVRIDNEAAFTENCNFDYARMLCVPSQSGSIYLSGKNNSYFYRLCEAYKSKTINLPLEDSYIFIKFVANFPEDFFEHLILSVKTENSNEIIDTNFEREKKKFGNFLEPIISRKRSLLLDFRRFYSNLASCRNEILVFHENNHDERKIIAQISQNLVEHTNELNKEKLRLENSPQKPIEIEAVVSLGGFQVLKNIYFLYWFGNKEELVVKCGEALDRLRQLDLAAINKNEKIALKYYIQEVKKIRSGKGASFAYNEINKVIANISPQE